MHGTSSRPSKCAARTRPSPAIMPSSSSISTGLVKPNSRIEAAICATCWSLCVEAAGEPRRVGVDEQVHQKQEPAEDCEPAEKIEHRRRSLAQLRGQAQDFAALLLP
jgi:hypothetical protein